MAYTPKLTYKGKPLVRKDNELYYGSMTDPYVLYLQILTTTPVGEQQVADKVHLMLLSTDTTKAPICAKSPMTKLYRVKGVFSGFTTKKL